MTNAAQIAEAQPVAWLHKNGEVFRSRAPNSTPLYLHPAADTKDAERHRFMRFADLDAMREKYWPEGEVPTGDAYDAAIDAAMKG